MGKPTYDLKPMKAPRAAGFPLRVLTVALEGMAGRMLGPKLLRDAGIAPLRDAQPTDPLPLDHPLFALLKPEEGSPPELEIISSAHSTPGFQFETAEDFRKAYREGDVDPIQVASRVLEATRSTESLTPAMRIFIAQREGDLLEQAEASAARYRAGRPLGPLDGVPVAVKDELHQKGYPTTAGTRFLGGSPSLLDATAVSRLRSAGALLIGKTNMHEIGLGVTGINPNHGTARNPYDPTRMTGGSSSGSAAAVAAGLCPLAVGADGGGSLRIPASLCGVVTLKATFGRISEYGNHPICWTVGHNGPIGASVRDVALGYAVMAGPDPKDRGTLFQPTPTLTGAFSEDLVGIKVGVYRPWFEDADAAVVMTCNDMLQRLRGAGAEVVEVEIPELALLRAAHQATILSEIACSHAEFLVRSRKRFGLEVRSTLALERLLKPSDYVRAQCLRPRILRHFLSALSQADAILTPTTACIAPEIPADALGTGESNLPLLDRLTRFAPAGNFTGLPAISFPAGYEPRTGMPIGLQAMGRPWEEALLLRIAYVAERLLERRPPKIHHRLIQARTSTISG